MKKITTLTLLLLTGIAGISQNRSQGSIFTTIPTIPPSGLGTQEIFRFRPGVFTQLQTGTTTFGFSPTDRWLSLGELTTPPSGQRLHGLRIQDEGKALVMGYSSIEANAFIQYIGPRGLDIRYANSFTSTVSNPAARFSASGNTIFGFSDPLILFVPTSQVDVQSRFSVGFRVRKGNNAILPANFTAGNFGGAIIATTATFTSDVQFKKDIKPEIDALKIIKGLKPVTFTFKADDRFGLSFTDQLQHGFIAQDLETVLPELVVTTTEDSGSYKSVNYIAIISILTKGLQELSAEVQLLQTQLAQSQSQAQARTYVVPSENFSNSEITKIAENGFYLGQNTPNPFSNSTEITYTFPKGAQNVVLMVFNLNGETLKEFRLNEDKGSVTLDASQFKPGLYLYSLISNNSEIITKKMLVK